MEEACSFAIERQFGKNISVNVDIKALKKSEAAQSILPNIKNTIAIVSGKGGVGKSLLHQILLLDLPKKDLK